MGIDILTRTLLKNSQNASFCWHFFKHLLSSPLPHAGPNSVAAIVRILVRAGMFPELDHLEILLSSLPPVTARHCLTALCSTCSQLDLLDRAISHFNLLRFHFPSAPPSVRLYNTLLTSSLKHGRSDFVSLLYKDMLLSKIVPDTYTFNLFINSLCELGCLNEARHLFEKMHLKDCSPNEYSYGILVRGYCKHSSSLQALEILDQMESSGCSPNQVIYSTVIAGLCKEGKTEEAEKLVAIMKFKGMFPDIVTFNTRISCLCRTGNVLQAAEIFRDMENGVEGELPKPNLVTYNVMLNGFCKSGMIHEAEALVEKMMSGGFFTTLKSYNIWLSGLVRNGRLLEAHSLLGEMVKNGVGPSTYSYNIVIDGLCRVGMIVDAKSALNLMRNSGFLPDVVTYSSLLHGFCNKGKVSEANLVLEEMLQNGCFPNIVTCNIMLQCLWRREKVVEAEKLLQKMNNVGYDLDIVTCNIVLDGLCRIGKLDRAVEMMNSMWVKGNAVLKDSGSHKLEDSTDSGKTCFPDVISYSTIISGLCKAGRLEDAKRKYIEMMRKNVAPDSFIYNIFIHGFCKHGKLSSAFRVLRDMENISKPNSRSYNSLMWGLNKKNRFVEINNLIYEMHQKGIAPDVFTYNNLMSSLCLEGKMIEAALLLEDMSQSGICPNLSSFSLLIKGFCKAGDLEAAQNILKISLSALGQKQALYSVMFNELVDKNEISKAKELLKTAVERGISIERFDCKSFIEAMCKEHQLDVANAILMKMINIGYIVDPAAFILVTDEFIKNGRKQEADKLTGVMMNLTDRRDKLVHVHSAESAKTGAQKLSCIKQDANYVKPREAILTTDWHNLLHRDDGSGLAMKVLKRVQRGWGQGSVLSVEPQKDVMVDHWDDFV